MYFLSPKMAVMQKEYWKFPYWILNLTYAIRDNNIQNFTCTAQIISEIKFRLHRESGSGEFPKNSCWLSLRPINETNYMYSVLIDCEISFLSHTLPPSLLSKEKIFGKFLNILLRSKKTHNYAKLHSIELRYRLWRPSSGKSYLGLIWTSTVKNQ